MDRATAVHGVSPRRCSIHVSAALPFIRRESFMVAITRPTTGRSKTDTRGWYVPSGHGFWPALRYKVVSHQPARHRHLAKRSLFVTVKPDRFTVDNFLLPVSCRPYVIFYGACKRCFRRYVVVFDVSFLLPRGGTLGGFTRFCLLFHRVRLCRKKGSEPAMLLECTYNSFV